MKYIVKKIVRILLILSLKRKVKVKFMIKSKLDKNTRLEGNNVVGVESNICSSFIGFGTYIGDHTKLNNCKVGRYCSIAQNVKIIAGRHPTSKFVSTHPAFFSTKKQAGFSFVSESKFTEIFYSNEKNNHLVEIGNDVWIGANVSILDGVKIGNGVIIAANSFVNKNLDDYEIYAGTPAKKIKSRFTESETKFLKDFQWWNKDIRWLKENKELFEDINTLMKVFKRGDY